MVSLAGIAMVTIICVAPFLLIAWIISTRGRGGQASNEERRQFEALLTALDRMEHRVDNLEIILNRGRE